MRCPITTHVLDTSRGKPASGIEVTLEFQHEEKSWLGLNSRVTLSDGRIEDLLKPGSDVKPGFYRLIFHTENYFKNLGQETFYPKISVLFKIQKSNEHYHIPLLLSPYGYSTYRGT